MGESTAILRTVFSVILVLTGLRSGTGSVAVSVFAADQKAAFPGRADGATQTHYIALKGQQEIEIPLSDIPDGTYAIAVMHDENESRVLETNFVGIPKEGFGFSNDPKVYFGPPSFEKASVQLAPGARLAVRMKYFL